MVRTGRVNAVSGNRARVFFPDTGLMSDWLYILRQPTAGVTGETDGHTHAVAGGRWAPSIGDTAVCLYPDGFNADGFILGVIV